MCSYKAAVVLLGGDEERECLCAYLCGSQSTQVRDQFGAVIVDLAAGCEPASTLHVLADKRTPIYVSSAHGSARATFVAAGVQPARLIFDHKATDTVTNFTTLIPEFRRQRVEHLVVVTSAYHMPRASAIAKVVLQCYRINFSFLSLPSTPKMAASRKEGHLRLWRDRLRAYLWARTGYDLGSWGRLFHPDRFYSSTQLKYPAV